MHFFFWKNKSEKNRPLNEKWISTVQKECLEHCKRFLYFNIKYLSSQFRIFQFSIKAKQIQRFNLVYFYIFQSILIWYDTFTISKSLCQIDISYCVPSYPTFLLSTTLFLHLSTTFHFSFHYLILSLSTFSFPLYPLSLSPSNHFSLLSPIPTLP